MADENGTPRTLDEAIALGLCAGPLKHIHENVRAHIRDYLAQRFGAYVLSNPGQEDMLMELFDAIVLKRKMKSEVDTAKENR